MVIGIGMRRSVGTLVTAALVLFLILTLEASPAAGASRTACRVTNTDSGRSYAALQAAVDAAGSGQTLIVRGTCHGTTVIGKDLVIQGVRTRRSDRPTLDGDGKDSVLTVRRVQVLIEDLTVQGGEMPRWLAPKGRRFGGGISNRGGTLVLRDVVVRRNRGKDGGGIFNTGALTLDGDTRDHAEPIGVPWSHLQQGLADTCRNEPGQRQRGCGCVQPRCPCLERAQQRPEQHG